MSDDPNEPGAPSSEGPISQRLQLGTLTPGPLPGTGTALDDLTAPATAARALLRKAALLYLARRAALRPGPAPAASDPAPADPRPLASPELAALSAYALRTPKLAAALPELLGLLTARGLRLPHRLTPKLLTLAETSPALRPLCDTLAGPRGAWVRAQLGPTSAPPPTDPDLLTSADRLALVQRLRASTDAPDHDRARVLIAELLPRERPDPRKALIAALADHLGPADQPLLEAALADRAAGVREAATLLLQRLPTSATATRIRARLAAAITRPATSDTLVMTAPPLDDDWARDGLTLDLVSGLPADLSRLIHLVRASPPEALAALTATPPPELVPLLATVPNPTLRGALLAALAAATLRFGAAPFAEPVWLAFARQPRSPTPIELLALVPPTRRDALITWRLGKSDAPDAAALPLLSALSTPWGADVSRLVASWVRAFRSPYELATSPLGAWLELIATRIAPGSLPSLLDRPQFFQGAMRNALIIAEARRRFHAALPPPGDAPIPSAPSPEPPLS